MCEHNKRAEPERYCAYCEVERLKGLRVMELIEYKEMREAIVRVRELAKLLQSEQDYENSQRILVALDGEK